MTVRYEKKLLPQIWKYRNDCGISQVCDELTSSLRPHASKNAAVQYRLAEINGQNKADCNMGVYECGAVLWLRFLYFKYVILYVLYQLNLLE